MTSPIAYPIWCRYFSLLILCLTGNTLCQAQFGFQVSPSRVYFNHKSKGEQTALLHLSNTTDTRLVLQATCADWRRDSVGTKVYHPSGTLLSTCCPLVKVTPSVIEMAPGEKRDVLITLSADEPKPNLIRNGMILLTQSNEHEVARLKGASQFIIKIELGVHVYVLPEESAAPDIAIEGMNVLGSGEQRFVNVKVHNNGGTLLESQLKIEYLNMETMEEVKAEALPVNTMPSDAFNVSATIPPKLVSGKYLIVAILDSGPSHALKVAELETTLK